MKIEIIGEGQTEYYCLPTLVSKFSHTIVGVHHLHGIGVQFDWEKAICVKVYPYVRAFAKRNAVNRPDKVIVVIDRETRMQCCPELSERATRCLHRLLRKENLIIPVCVVIPNRIFESWLFADPKLLDNSPLFKTAISKAIGNQSDEKNIEELIKTHLKPGKKWVKDAYGKKLAQSLDLRDSKVLKRSRSLAKFVKELQNIQTANLNS